MRSARRKARLVGAAMAVAGLAVLVMAISGARPQWMDDWVFRCGARGMSHACGEGEIPWGIASMAVLGIVVGLVIFGGEVRTRRGSFTFRVHLHAGKGERAGVEVHRRNAEDQALRSERSDAT